MSAVRTFLRAIEPHPGEHFKDKIIAVALALVVWFGVNTQDVGTQIFQAVPVSVTNLPDNLASSVELRDTLTVWLSGSGADLARVTPGLLSPEIDLSEAVAGQRVYTILPTDLRVPTGVAVTQINPSEITISLEEKIEKSVRVAPVISGEPAPGYQVVGRSTDPTSVSIRGPRSIVEPMERIDTAIIDVRGRTGTFSQSVVLNAGSSLVEFPAGARTVQLTIDITERAVSQQFDEVEVVVINNRYQVAVNPTQLGVLVSGAPSVLARLDSSLLRLVIDAAELDPAVDDYRLEPTLQVADEGFEGAVEMVALYPQRLVNVHVFQQPARR